MNFSNIETSPTNRGFTLLEVLVALLVLTIVASAALESQILSIKIEEKARMLQLFRFEVERIYSVTQRAKDPQELAQLLLTTNNLCRVKSEPVIMAEGTNETILLKHELSGKAGQSFSTEFYNRFPGYGAEVRLAK